MEALILCRFNTTYGPKVFLKAPKSLNEDWIKDIPLLMDLPSKGIFLHIFEDIKTANLFFDIPSEHARGGKENLLVSIITDINSNLQLMLARELLESFAKDLINIEDAYKAFNIEAKVYKGDPDKLKEIENLFFSFFKSIKPAIKTLELAEHRYQALFKAARDAIFIIDRDLGIIVDANIEAEKLIELPREDIIGHQPSQFKIFSPEILETIITKHSSIQNASHFFTKLKNSNEQNLFLEVNANEIELGDQHLIQFLFHDITEIKKAEEKIREHVKKIEFLNKIITIANQADDLSLLLEKILESIMDFLNFDGCCIYLTIKNKNVAKIEVYKGFSPDFIKNNSLLQINKNPYDFVFVKGVATFNDNFPEINSKFFEGTKFRSTAIIPLFSKFEIIGAIVMGFKNYKSFSADEKDLLISIGLEIGTAIKKMKYEENLRRSVISR
ncbi:MAG: GAF domain-containing protein [Promethearchaeota archaeon]